MLLDEAMPRWDRRERHRTETDAAPPVVFRAIEDLTWGEVPAFKALMIARGLGRPGLSADEPVLTWFTSAGFVVLARRHDEMLVVTTQRVRRVGEKAGPPESVESFRSFDQPGHVKIAFNFRYGDGLLTSETRVVGTDARSRRMFAAYWFVIRIGSGIIRRVWLRAIRKRAESGSDRVLGARRTT